MTGARRAADVSWRAWWRRFVENVLPWYDVADARRRKARSDAIVTELHVNTRNAEAVRKAYESMGDRLDRRRS